MLDLIIKHAISTPAPRVTYIRMCIRTLSSTRSIAHSQLPAFNQKWLGGMPAYSISQYSSSTKSKTPNTPKVSKTSKASKASKASKPLSLPKATEQLSELSRLMTEVNATPSKNSKITILQQYPHCLSILQQIYDPDSKFNVTSKSVINYVQKEKYDFSKGNEYGGLSELLEALKKKEVTGYAAQDDICRFIRDYCTSSELLGVFLKILDKNLKVGINRGLINSAFPSTITKFNVALAEQLKPDMKEELFDGNESIISFFASRKLDGVRVIMILENLKGAKDGISISSFSRNNKPFSNLKVPETTVKNELLAILKKARKDAKMFIEQANVDGGLVLDGEMCILDPIPGKSGFRENFLEATRAIKGDLAVSKDLLSYFVFDCLTKKEFLAGKSERIFSERWKVLQKLFPSISRTYDMEGSAFRLAEQTKIENKQQLDEMISSGIEQQWEGVMLRKDVAYEGKRSKNLLKIKQWMDAEFIVEGVETGLVRNPRNGLEEEMVTSLVINHKGNKVNVASGLTMDQRIRYFEDPKLVIGKEIVVKYFAEFSDTDKQRKLKKRNIEVNTDAVSSLRFPTLKAVYESGRREF